MVGLNSMRSFPSVILVLGILLTSCSQSPEHAPLRTTPIAMSDLAGVWQLDRSSLELVQTYSKSSVTNISLNLRSSGELVALNFPLDVGTHNSSLSLVSGIGAWEIDQPYAAFKLRISFEKHGQPLEIREFNGAVILTMTLDNPDSGRVVVFRR